MRVDGLGEVRGGGAHRLLEQGQQQLVLAGEVLVEAAQRLAGALHDLLDREVLALGAAHQLEGGVEEPLHPLLGPRPGGIERAGDGQLAPGRRGALGGGVRLIA